MTVLHIEASVPEFTIYLDPPLQNPQTISMHCVRVGIPSSKTPPTAIHIYCDLIDSEDVRFHNGKVAKRAQLLTIIHQKRGNQMNNEAHSKVKLRTNRNNHVYRINFRVTDQNENLFQLAPEKINLEIEIC